MKVPSQEKAMQRKRSTCGLGLLESLAALCIAAFIAAAFLPGLLVAHRGIKKSTAVEAGTELANQRAESLRSAGYAALPAIPAGGTEVTQSFVPAGALLDPLGSQTVTRVNEVFQPSTTETNRRLVRTSVSWRDEGKSTRHSANVTTLIIKP